MAYYCIYCKENQTMPQSLLVCLQWCLPTRLQHTEAVAENSDLGLNLGPFQSNHSQSLLCFLGKDKNVFHTSIHNKFLLRGSPVEPLFVSGISYLEVFFQFAPQKKNFT